MFCDLSGLLGLAAVSLNESTIPVYTDSNYLGSLLQTCSEIDKSVQRIKAGWRKLR